MKISQVDIYYVTYPGETRNFNPVILQIQTDEGVSGVGELALAYGVGGSAGVGMLREMAETFLIGADPFRIEWIWDRLFRKTFWGQGGGPVVYGGISAIDIALWDIKGKVFGLPVYEMLGGRCHEKLWCYYNGWYGGCKTPEDYAEASHVVTDAGYKALKFDPFAIRPDGEWDYSPRYLNRERANLAFMRVEAVRDAVGPDVEILVEVHGNLGTSSAIQMGKRLEELDCFFYEEPVDAMNVESMKQVAQNVAIPIAAGERIYTRYGFRQYVEEHALAILQPDIGLAGGISELKKIATYAETYNLHFQPHNYASPVNTAASIQVDACCPNFIIQEIFPTASIGKYEMVNRAFEQEVVGGYVTPPSEPGLGIELNMDFMKGQECVSVSEGKTFHRP